MGTDRASRIGIIGDGQLGMMLCEAAAPLGLQTVMLAADRDCPAARLADEVIEGAMDDAQAIEALIAACDAITYEREDIPPATVLQLREASRTGRVHCYPPLHNIEILQDKARQKAFLADNQLATLPYLISDGSPDRQREAVERLGLPLVQKSLRGGFDGRGVQLLRDEAALVDTWPGATLLEQHAGEFSEVAVLVARDRAGNMAHFGPVDMTFEDSHAVLDTVTAPSRLAEAIQSLAVSLACSAISALDGVGVYGVEMFVLTEGQVVINEISPRVHNAGHYSRLACRCSQFEQQLRAVAGLPLADTTLQSPAAMRNILATAALQRAGSTQTAGYGHDALGAELYWYGKSPARSMRKLGHITALGEDAQAALATVNASWNSVQEQAERTS